MEKADDGNNQNNLVQNLSKVKTMELDIECYSGLVQEISALSLKLMNDNHPDAKVFKNTADDLSIELKNLENMTRIQRDLFLSTIKLQHPQNNDIGVKYKGLQESLQDNMKPPYIAGNTVQRHRDLQTSTMRMIREIISQAHVPKW